MTIENAVAKVLKPVRMWSDVRGAEKYLAPDLVVKATAQRRKDSRARGRTFIVTIGKPNYRERAFIKKCKAAGEPFPVKKIMLRLWPKKR